MLTSPPLLEIVPVTSLVIFELSVELTCTKLPEKPSESAIAWYSASTLVNTDVRTVTVPADVIEPLTVAFTVGPTVAFTSVTVTPAPRPPAPDRPDELARETASLSIVTEPAELIVPSKDVVTSPSAWTVGIVKPMPAPSPAASDQA